MVADIVLELAPSVLLVSITGPHITIIAILCKTVTAVLRKIVVIMLSLVVAKMRSWLELASSAVVSTSAMVAVRHQVSHRLSLTAAQDHQRQAMPRLREATVGPFVAPG